MSETVALVILDGWGMSDIKEGNAIAEGRTPVFDQLDKQRPPIAIDASGEAVGLPAGQMGNSEVGHLNIGAGRVVYQDLLRISKSIDDGSFFRVTELINAMRRAKQNGKALHLLGLLSDGGVHSHIDHIFALLKLARQNDLEKVFVHPFMDGRDTSPTGGAGYIKQLEEGIKRIGVGKIATVQGRFYAMDRDTRWDRVQRAYNLMVDGEGKKFGSAVEAVEASYKNGVTDEFIEPALIAGDGEQAGLINSGDEAIMFNFRADRMREIVRALYDPSFSEFGRKSVVKINVTCLTEYDARFGLPVAYKTTVPEQGLGQTLAENNSMQFRTAETEKYAHVTFFFNGGIEKTYKGESRKLIASPRVRTYDLKPEMSCNKVTDAIVGAVESKQYKVIIANLANGDMVGHTGVWEAALKAVNVVDTQVGRIIKACGEAGADLLITADHGNIEKMINNDGSPMTAHTTNQVPFYYIGDSACRLREGGCLADIAPTILKLTDIPKPDEMTGVSLLV
ncbi:2,3-bisphosphoglycerate-independent phosphoglycerate mutase [hydrothermal vent metagenome]|uniref:2,3-bisphosphoglycerate-independent phosphoglycerate mutase n=1 Tax=hydrothermal vent metagenome TaxID=652676 RepID=A0A3B1BWV6_9ZZZZ